MSLKISYNQDVHRVTKLPTSHKNLVETVQGLFKSGLPTNWCLQYLDSDGDKVHIKTDDDIKAMLKEFEKSSQSIKIYVVPRQDDLQAPDFAKCSSDDYYKVIEKDDMIEVTTDPIIKTLQDQVNSLKESLSEAEEENAKLKEDLKKVGFGNGTIVKKTEDLQKEVLELRTRLAWFQDESKKNNNQDKTNKRIQELELLNRTLEEQNEELRLVLDEHDKERTASKSKIDGKEKELKELKKKLDDKIKELEKAKVDNVQLVGEFTNLKKQLADAQKNIGGGNQKLEKEVRDLKEKIKDHESIIETYQNEVERFQKLITDFQNREKAYLEEIRKMKK